MSDESLIDKAPLLPGLGDDLPAPLDDDQLAALPIFTASQVFERDELKYKLAVALFFGEGISLRGVCRLCHISCHTMQSIIRRECGSEWADRWRKVASGDLRAAATMAISRAHELLADDEAVKTAGIKGLATFVRESTHAHELLNQRLPGQGDTKQLSQEQQAKLYIEAQAQAQTQSIEVGEKSEPARDLESADPAESEG
jgi:hypothetical protein